MAASSADADPAMETSSTASDAAFPSLCPEWPDTDARFPSNGSTPPPLTLQPLVSPVSPGGCATLRGLSAEELDDVIAPSFTVLGSSAMDLTRPDGPASSPRGHRQLSETMESMDFAAQLEKLSEKDLEALWATLWSSTHSQQALTHALAGPQTGWNPYRAARSGPHLRREIMNNQVVEFKDVIPQDSLCLLGTATRRPALARPPGTDREAGTRRRRAELDNLVHRSSTGAPRANGGRGGGLAVTDSSPDLPAALLSTTPVVWTLPSDAPLTVTGTSVRVHTSAETQHLVAEADRSGSEAFRGRVARLVEEDFAWHGRQPVEDVLTAHRSGARVASQAHTSDGEVVASDGTAPRDGHGAASFACEAVREALETRLFDALWQRVVVPFYTPPAVPEHATEAVARLPTTATPAAPARSPPTDSVSPAMRPRRPSLRSSASKASLTSSTSASASEALRQSGASATELSIVLHLRRHSVQESLDGAMDSLGSPQAAPSPPASRRHVTYCGTLAGHDTAADSTWLASGHDASDPRRPSPHSRPRPRTGPVTQRKPSPSSTAVVTERLQNVVARPTRGSAPQGRKRSTSSHLRRPRDEARSGEAPPHAPQDSSMHMEDLDDASRGPATTTAADPRADRLRRGQQAPPAPPQALAPLQRAANQTLAEMGQRRRGPSGLERSLGKRAPPASAATTAAGPATLRGYQASPYLEAERRGPRRTAATASRASRPTSVGDKPRTSGRLRADAASPVRHGSPLDATEGPRRVSPATRRARVQTAQVHSRTASRAHSPLGPHRATTTLDLWDDSDYEVNDPASRSASANGRLARHALPALDGAKAAEKELAEGGSSGGAGGAVRRAARRGGERPVTEHGGASQAYRPYLRQPVAVRTLEGTSRRPSPVAAGKRLRNLTPLDQVHHAYGSPSS